MTGFIKHIILDIDGTLVDSNDAHAYAWVEAMKEVGYHVALEKVRPLIGMGGDKVLPETLGLSKESEEGQKISKRRKEIFLQKYLPRLRSFPQAWELLLHMRNQGLTLAIATSAEPDELRQLLQRIHPKAPEIFAQQTSAQDAQKSKPDADVIQAALQRLNTHPDEALMIGDTPYDIEAASSASVKTIAFRCGGWSDHHLQGAIAIYNDPADLLAHYNTSPIARLSRV